MDGNGRWAKKQGKLRSAGHIKGAEVFRTITRHCEKLGIEALTVYAFSTENWKRPAEEVDALMQLFHRYLREALDFTGENIRMNFIGDRAPLGAELQKLMARLEEESADNTGLILNIAINYGGRDEIVRAAAKLVQTAQQTGLEAKDITAQLFEQQLYTAGQPEVDMILRPSGEHRISNFLLWQCAYSEFVYMDVLWPDFTPEHLELAIAEYQQRKRRFGAL